MENIKEREVFANPYVVQMDRFADSLRHLSEKFLHLEDYKGSFTRDEVEEMFLRVSEKVCSKCERKQWCLVEDRVHTSQMVYEILCTVEEYGAELNIETKRRLQKKCLMAPRFLREMLEVFENAKQRLLWNNQIVQNRQGCAVQLNSFANVIRNTVREIDAGIFEDEHLEKRIKNRLKRIGVKVISSVFLLTRQGCYEIHLTLRTGKGQCLQTKEIARVISECVGRTMVPEQGERMVVGEEYCTVVWVEGPRFHTLQGVARIGKGCDSISGDTFLMKNLPGGKQGVVLSDGMGSGEAAYRESAMVVEMMEELLMSGFPADTAVQLMNTALVTGREEVRFSTIDMCLFDLYQGECEFVKAGASSTFIRHDGKTERITSDTLPIGVLPEISLKRVTRQLSDGDFVVFMTDGVLDALPAVEQEALMGTFIGGNNINNPGELAHHVLGQVLEWTGEPPMDDMTVIAVGIWRI